jgi:formiminoglutamase
MVKREKFSYHGRIDDSAVPERLHQVIKSYDEKSSLNQTAPVFIGFSSDEGVRRNKGRTGAKEGPFKVREMLASLPWTAPIYDYGTLNGTKDLERSQQQLGEAVSEVLSGNGFPLIIGGGHETLYGHYLGVRDRFPQARLAVINFDAHFDLRQDTPSSGTMFHQILTHDKNIDYYVFGIQEGGNTQTLFKTADELNVKYALIEEVIDTDVFANRLEEIAEQYDAVFATLCMDSIKEGDAPGVSAPTANGFAARDIHRLVKKLAGLDSLVSFDISEVSPELDINHMTSRLAASIFHSFLINREFSK